MTEIPVQTLTRTWWAAFIYVCLASAAFLLVAGPWNALNAVLGTGFGVFLASGFLVHILLVPLTTVLHMKSKGLPKDERGALNVPLKWFGVVGLFVFSLPLLAFLLILLGLASPG